MTLRSHELTAWLSFFISEAWLENELGSPVSIITNQFPLENFLPLSWYSCFLFEEKKKLLFIFQSSNAAVATVLGNLYISGTVDKERWVLLSQEEEG